MLHETSPLAVLISAAFVVGVIGLSFWLGRKKQSATAYYAAHGEVHWFVNGIAFVGDYLSAASFLGICGMIAFSGYDGFLYSIGNRTERVRYTLPRHKRGNWIGPGRTEKSTRPGAGGVIELTLFEFLDRLAALIPPPRRHRHRYHGVVAPNHPLRQAITAIAFGNIGK